MSWPGLGARPASIAPPAVHRGVATGADPSYLVGLAAGGRVDVRPVHVRERISWERERESPHRLWLVPGSQACTSPAGRRMPSGSLHCPDATTDARLVFAMALPYPLRAAGTAEQPRHRHSEAVRRRRCAGRLGARHARAAPRRTRSAEVPVGQDGARGPAPHVSGAPVRRLEVDPGRLPRWVEGFAARHGDPAVVLPGRRAAAERTGRCRGPRRAARRRRGGAWRRCGARGLGRAGRRDGPGPGAPGWLRRRRGSGGAPHGLEGGHAVRPVAHRGRRLVAAAVRPAAGQPGRRARRGGGGTRAAGGPAVGA